VPAVSTAPTMALLTYSFRYVFSNLGIFAGLSGVLVAAFVASFFATQILVHAMGFHISSRLMELPDMMVASLIGAAASAFIVLPITAGIYGVAFRMLDGAIEPIKGFSMLQKRYVPVATVSLIVSVAMLIVRLITFQAMPRFVGGVVFNGVFLVVGSAVMLGVPAVVRFGMSPVEALLYSVRRFGSAPLAYLGYSIAASLMGFFGLFGCGIGVICTLGMTFVATALLLLEPKAEA